MSEPEDLENFSPNQLMKDLEENVWADESSSQSLHHSIIQTLSNENIDEDLSNPHINDVKFMAEQELEQIPSPLAQGTVEQLQSSKPSPNSLEISEIGLKNEDSTRDSTEESHIPVSEKSIDDLSDEENFEDAKSEQSPSMSAFQTKLEQAANDSTVHRLDKSLNVDQESDSSSHKPTPPMFDSDNSGQIKASTIEPTLEKSRDFDHEIQQTDFDGSKDVQTIEIPTLEEVLTGEQKMAIAALCYLIINDLTYRYARFEFIDILGEFSEKKTKHVKEDLISRGKAKVFGRRNSGEDKHLLASSDDEESHDLVQEEQSEKKDVAVSPKKEYRSLSKIPYERIPFGDELSNPEGVEDILYFGKTLVGNMSLCYALKTYQEWGYQIMDKIYDQLAVSPEERLFIEQSIKLGLRPSDLVKCLLPLNGTFNLNFSQLDLVKLQNHQQFSDKRIYILLNLMSILIQNNLVKDTKARSFLRCLAVDHLKVGNWCDVIEHVEIPVSLLMVSATSPIVGVSNEQLDRPQEELTEDQKLSADETSIVLKNNEKQVRATKDKRKRMMLMTAAAVSGGAIIGVSVGVAAPIITAGLGAALAAMKVAGATTVLGSVGSTAILTSGAVLTGTSWGGMKMEKRTRGIEVFKFIPIQANKDRSNLIIYLAGWLDKKKGKGKNVPMSRRRALSNEIVNESTDADQKSVKSSSSSLESRNRSSSHSSSTLSETEEDQDAEELVATGLEDLIIPFAGVSPLMGSQYTLCFDPHELAKLGDSLKIFASELISFSAQQILQQTILAGIISGLSWPLWLVKLGYLVDNPWSVGLDRAKKAGLILADALANNAHQDRPVTLIGYSLGARAIFYCLRELALRGKFGIVEDVFLFGTPVLVPHVTLKNNGDDKKASNPTPLNTGGSSPIVDPSNVTQSSPNSLKSLDEWREALSAVNGRLFNCYSRSDWVLGFLFRAGTAGVYDVAGLSPIILDENETPDIITLTPPSSNDSPGKSTDRNSRSRSRSSSSSSSKSSSTEAPEPLANACQRQKLENSKKRKLAGRIVQNVDITEYVSGHIHYRNMMPTLLNRVCDFATWSQDTEVLEQVVAGDWMDSIDGWWMDETQRLKKQRQRQRENDKKKLWEKKRKEDEKTKKGSS